MRIAPEGRPFIGGAWGIALVLGLSNQWPGLVLWIPVAVWVTAFFRDPDRQGPRGEDLILAPADGKVVGILEIDEPDFCGERMTRVSIFMNVFNVHVNRYPAGGTVAYRHYNPGRFGHAASEKASQDNEQASIGLQTSRGRLLVRQIAGLVARRIVTDHNVGTAVTQGERMGLIRFGSRVDVFVPRSATVEVQDGAVTRAAVTVVARWA